MPSPLARRQLLVFGLVWCGYTLTYLLRKPLGVIKLDLKRHAGLDETTLGWLDAALLTPYALAQIALAGACERAGARLTLGLGLCTAGTAMLGFGLSSTGPLAMALMLAVNGAGQSVCWAACARSLSDWFPEQRRNSVFGLFGTSAFAGGILGSALAVAMQAWLGWRLVFLVPSLLCMCFGLLVMLVLRSPQQLAMTVPGSCSPHAVKQPLQQPELAASGPGWRDALRIPAVPSVAGGLFCLKLVRYAMYMWLPLYLSTELQYSTGAAGLLSVAFDAGAVLGSVLMGAAVDRLLPGRALLACLLAAMAAACSLPPVLLMAGWGPVPAALALLVAGACNGGPDTLLSGAVPSELGQRDPRRMPQATCAAVNGLGSLGAVLEGPLLGAVSQRFGWSAVFYMMMLSCSVSAACIFRAEVVERRYRRAIGYAPAPDA